MEPKDLEFLRKVDALARQGLKQEQIAREVGYQTASGLHARVNRLGFRLTPLTEVRQTLTGLRLSEALAADQPAGASA